MIYSFDLYTALLFTGLLLIAAHLFALIRGAAAQQWLRLLPRSQTAGFVLLIIAAIWAWFLIKTIDLGEFSNWRSRVLIIIPIVAVLTLKYVDEFLAARALGMLALLAAEPLLEAAWLRPENGRLLLVVLAYAWIIFGMFWIGTPYTLRDQIAWVTKTASRWHLALFGGIAYGAALIFVALTLHR
ncbi:MAG: hypothetical protein JWL90_3576 [Chthoniobacteraceae bacterium]|nr:hypothetical protein [Chthoniobacteraceae bacterium]